MNWGLFLGCKVRMSGRCFVGDYFVKDVMSHRVQKDTYLLGTDRGTEYAKHCKPILRPLSSMTDDEKGEFNKMFFVPKKRAVKFEIYGEIIRVTMLPNPEVFRSEVEKIYDKSFPTTGICTVKETLWLMEKGFYIGQCELSECIIEEV